MHVSAIAYLTGGIGREAVIGKVLNLALQAGDSSSGAATDMVLANWAIPDKSSLACLCSLFPANRDNSCIAASQVTAMLYNVQRSRATLWRSGYPEGSSLPATDLVPANWAIPELPAA